MENFQIRVLKWIGQGLNYSSWNKSARINAKYLRAVL